MNILQIVARNQEIFAELVAAAIDEMVSVGQIALNELNIEEADRHELEQHVFEIDGPSEQRLHAYWEIAMCLQEINRRTVAPYSQLPSIRDMSSEDKKLFMLCEVVFPEVQKMLLSEFTELKGAVVTAMANNNTTAGDLQICEEYVPMAFLEKPDNPLAITDVYGKQDIYQDFPDHIKINSF